MGILGFQKYSRFLPVAYDSASFAAMHFRPTIYMAKSKGMNFIDYSISLMYWSGLKTGPAKPGRHKNLKKVRLVWTLREEMGIV